MTDLTLGEVAAALGLPADSEPAALLAAARAQSSGRGRGRKRAKRSAETSDSARYWAAAAIDTAIDEGKIAASQREVWIDRFAGDPDRWVDHLESLTPLPEMSPSALVNARTRGRTPVYDVRDQTHPLARMKVEHPDTYAWVESTGVQWPSPWAEGDRPRMLASGLDPGVVDGLPLPLAMMIVDEPSPVEVRRLLSGWDPTTGGFDAIEALDHPGYLAYCDNITRTAIRAGIDAAEPTEAMRPTDPETAYGDLYGEG